MGRPLTYKTVDELQAAIDRYFDECKGKQLEDKDGNLVFDKYGRPVIVDARPPSVTGLALALGFTSRKALLDYQGRSQFCNTVKRAKMRCEAYTESRLYDRDGSRGAEFSLKYNFGWGDGQSEATGNDIHVVIEGGDPEWGK